jgi:hypothetical protein
MKWWEKEFLRISAVQCKYDEDSMDILKKHVVPRHFNTEQLLHLTAEGHMAFYEEERHGALLNSYLAEAHRNHIREIIYLNVHCFVKRIRDAHPEWVQRDRDGKEILAYGVDYFACINSGWFAYFADNLSGLCRHEIDGIFLDGPVLTQQGCFCPACCDKFRRHYGKSIHDASSAELMEFKVDSVTEFIKKTHDIVKGINPDILLYLNNSALRADVTGSNTRKVEPYVDMLGAEGGFAWVNRDLTLWQADSMARYIETQARGKSTVIFIAGDHKPYSYYMHTAAETKILYAQSVANGANVWYGIHAPTYIMDTPGGKAAVEFNAFLEQNEACYRNTKPVSKVALMWSMDSANHYSSSVAATDFTQSQQLGPKAKQGNHYESFMGFYEMLVRSHIPFEVVDECNVQDGTISKYDVLILPTCACMSRETAANIRSFVENGGRILATFDTGFYDEKGRYLGKSGLEDVLGIQKTDGTIEYGTPGTGFHRIRKDSWMAHGLSADLIPSPSLAVRFTPSSGTQIPGVYLRPMESRYVALPTDGFPAIAVHRYGKGAGVYIGGTAGEFYYSSTNPDYRCLVANIVNRFSSEILKTDAPGSVEMVLRHQEDKGRYILHVINMTGEMARPIERILPVQDIHVTLHLDKTVHGANWITAVEDSDRCEFSCQDGTVQLTIPVVKEYEVIILE